MEWDSIITIIIGLLAIVGVPFAFRNRKKGSPGKVNELCQHLEGMGVKASMLEEGATPVKTGGKRSFGHKSVGSIKLANKNIDSINVIGVANQYGVTYFLDFLIRSSSLIGSDSKKRTMMVKKRTSALWGKVVDIGWKGDALLAQKLNFDYKLKDKLLQADIGVLKNGLQIFPEPKHGYTRIRTAYFLPEADLFEAIDAIAKHIKSGW